MERAACTVPDRDAAIDAEQVRLAIDSLKPFGGISKVTGSIGVATSCAKLADAKSLMAAADEAMYVSKWTTKNYVTVWPPPADARQRADSAKLLHRMGNVERVLQDLQAQNAAKDERERKDAERLQKIVAGLAELMNEGAKIKSGLEWNNMVSAQAVAPWKQRVAQYLTENLGEPFAVRFQNPSYDVSNFPGKMPTAMFDQWAIVVKGMMMLNDFMSEHRA
jgi:hypothetical protein